VTPTGVEELAVELADELDPQFVSSAAVHSVTIATDRARVVFMGGPRVRTWFARVRRVFADVNRIPAAPGSAQWWRDRYLQRLRARGRGLSIEQVCQEALRIVDEGGLRDLTMRRLADELGTGPASLYRYVSSREELLVEVADLVLGELDAPDPALHWREAVARLAHDLRRVLVGHRGLVVISSNAPLLGPNAMRVRELFWSVMDREQCEPEFAVQTYAAVMHFVVCSAIFSAAAAQRGSTAWSGEASSGLNELLDLLPARRYPTVLKFSEYAEMPDPERDFSLGLRALIDGLWQSQHSSGSVPNQM
jgi:AcrR family transcriptional regulator